jgi:tripartite ATP-independent transporter DctM subunit
MAWYWALTILVGSIAGFIVAGLPVAVAFILANLIGTLIFLGGLPGLLQLVENSTDLVTTFTLAPVPLFILMGGLFFHTGLAKQVFDALDRLMGRLPGRLSYLAVGGGTVFATLTGSSLANAAMLGSLLTSEMQARRYKPHMSIGPILGVGGLAIIIPPSAIAVLLAGIANVDVGKLLIAGLLPGLLIAALFLALIWLQIRIDPEAAPAYDVRPVSAAEVARLILVDTLPIFIIIVMVVGFILGGIATPTESAAFGVIGTLGAAALFRKLTLRAVILSLKGTVMVGCMVFFIVMGSAVFSQLLAFSGASRGFLTWATGIEASPYALLALMLAILLVLGTFMDQVSIMLVTVPIFFPLAAVLGFDPIWFAIIMLLAVEIGLTTPPFGLLLFVMMGQAPPGVTFGDVVRAGLPFLGVNLVVIGLLILFPGIALWLPSLL